MEFVRASIAPVGTLWGYAEADPTIVGIVVIAIAVLAVGYVLSRIRRDRSRRSGKDSGTRG